MKKKLWFKAKEYGWGWYPSSYEGWFILLLFITLNFFNFFRFYLMTNPYPQFILEFVIESLFMSVILILICFIKGEKPRWRWG